MNTTNGPQRGTARRGRIDLTSGVVLGVLGIAAASALLAGSLALQPRASAEPLDQPAERTPAATATVRPALGLSLAVPLAAGPTAVAEAGWSNAAPADAAPETAAPQPPTPTATAPATATATPVAPTATPVAIPSATADRLRVVDSQAYTASTPPLERTHTVSAGDTLSAIAQRYGVSVATMIANNSGVVTERDVLKIGQTLRVPPKDGLLYAVRYGDTLQGIAARYGVTVPAILAEPANALPSADLLQNGQTVFLPGVHDALAVRAPVPAPTQAAPVRSATEAPVARSTSTLATATAIATATLRAAPPTPAAIATAAATAARSSGGWRWPISGPLSSVFGPSHPLGIDIDLYGREGTPIAAALGGTVTFAGGNPCCSYGYYVEIDHGNGMTSLYAHFNQPPPVRIGQRVEQGQVVGYAGTTGYSTGVHLHFEIRRGGVPLDPISLLP